jgi:hypothetical protein
VWIQIERELMRHTRFLILPLPVRYYYMEMLSEGIESMSDTLSLVAWSDTRVMRIKIGLGADEYPELTAESALDQMAGEASHLIDIDKEKGTITIRGFMQRYGPMFEKRRKDIERKRAQRRSARKPAPANEPDEREAPEDLPPSSPDTPQDDPARGQNGDGARTAHGRPEDSPSRPRVELDTEPEGAPTEGAPPARHPGKVVDTSPELGPKPATTARNGHRDHSDSNSNGNGQRQGVLPDGARIGVDEARIPPPISPAAGQIFDQWISDANGTFRKVEVLRGLVRFRDNNDPLWLLAHLLELGKPDDTPPAERLAMLYQRLSGNGILPAEWAIKEARRILNDDKGPRGGVPKSLTGGLQDGLDRRKAMAALAELGTEAAKAIDEHADQLISEWEPTKGTLDDHMTAMHAFRMLVAGDPIRGLAYIEQVTRSVPDDGGRVTELARLCKMLATPHPACQSHAIGEIRNLVAEMKSTAKAGA